MNHSSTHFMSRNKMNFDNMSFMVILGLLLITADSYRSTTTKNKAKDLSNISKLPANKVGATEMAVPKYSSCSLVEEIHGVRSMADGRVWVEAGSTRLDWLAIHSILCAAVINIAVKPDIICGWLGNAPYIKFGFHS